MCSIKRFYCVLHAVLIDSSLAREESLSTPSLAFELVFLELVILELRVEI